MRRNTHKNGSICVSILALLLVKDLIVYYCDGRINKIVAIILFVLSSVLGALLPDIDHGTSTISNSLGFLSKILSKLIKGLFGHRGLTHSLLFASIFLLPNFIFFFNIENNIRYITISISSGIFIGIISHITLDCLTPQKVKLFLPFSSKKFGITLIKNRQQEAIFNIVIITLTILEILFIVQNI